MTKEEMNKLMEATIENDFYYMLFLVAKTTGRRLGELYGNQKRKLIGRKVIGKKIEYDENGKEVPLAKTRAIYKKIPYKYEGGVKVKDIDFEKGIMKIWVLKRRKLVQDETILIPEALRTIKHYVLRNKLKPEDYLFRQKTYRTIQEAIKRYAKKAGIEHKVSFHNFRHYFVTELKRLGYTNDKIAKLTGHKTTSTLTIYDHVLASDLKDEVTKDIASI
ncbi:MAG: tyrosine-type recombinase/integrase [Nanoarchaeota archaeon]